MRACNLWHSYLISALTIRTQHTKQERTTSGQEGQDKRPRPSVWLGQAHRASASREQPFRGTSAIVVRSSFDGASVAGAYRAHIDHAARADSDHAQRSRDELILGLLVGHAEAVAADSRAAHSPSAWYARAIANAAPPASAQRTASLRRALERSNASPAQAAQGPGTQNRATWCSLGEPRCGLSPARKARRQTFYTFQRRSDALKIRG